MHLLEILTEGRHSTQKEEWCKPCEDVRVPLGKRFVVEDIKEQL